MREIILKSILNKVGFPSMPKTQSEFFEMAKNNPEFESNLKNLENKGILKKNPDGSLVAGDQNFINNLLQTAIKSKLGSYF